ncbi:MAG TPA: GGDEF domain-containing protein [bacterium]|nr:GGDEF domain-containing protein [bacterium]
MNKTVFALLFIVVSAVAVFFSREFHFIENYLKLSPQIIYAAAGLAFLICLRFNKSRVAFMLFLILLWFFKDNPGFVSKIPENEFMFFITFNVLYITTSKERGILSIHGLKKVLFIVSQFWLIYYFTIYQPTYYNQSANSVIKTIQFMMGMQFHFLPFVMLGLAVVRNIFSDKSYEVSTALGISIAFLILTTLKIDLSSLNLLTGFALIFTGILSSIYSTSYTDELTGLPARRAYNEYTSALGAKYAIAMTDIDHFKKFNDTYGHDTGDEVLKLVAKVISSVGGGGKAFRFGGEEFVIVFSGKTKEETAEHLENIREKLQNTPFTVRNRKNRSKYKKTGKKSSNDSSKTVKITMSIGASDSRAEKTVAKVMKKADQQLYKAKKTGRNKVII